MEISAHPASFSTYKNDPLVFRMLACFLLVHMLNCLPVSVLCLHLELLSPLPYFSVFLRPIENGYVHFSELQ